MDQEKVQDFREGNSFLTMFKIDWENSSTFSERASSSLARSLKNGIKIFPIRTKLRDWSSLV